MAACSFTAPVGQTIQEDAGNPEGRSVGSARPPRMKARLETTTRPSLSLKWWSTMPSGDGHSAMADLKEGIGRQDWGKVTGGRRSVMWLFEHGRSRT